MIAPTPEENTDEVVDNEITNVIDENNNAENDNTTSEENLPSEENVDTNSEEL